MGKVRPPPPWRLVTRSQTRTARIMAPPTAISPTPPRRLSLAGASSPILMAEAISSLGSENPSWAQRNGRISSSAKLLEAGITIYLIVFTGFTVPHGRYVRVLVDDNVELELGTDGEGEPEVWGNVHIKLMLLFLWIETLDRIQILLVSLKIMNYNEDR